MQTIVKLRARASEYYRGLVQSRGLTSVAGVNKQLQAEAYRLALREIARQQKVRGAS